MSQLSESRAAVISYRCYFLDDEDHIRAFESIHADAPADAVEQALALLKERPHHRAVELWEGAKRVYPAPVDAAAHDPKGLSV